MMLRINSSRRRHALQPLALLMFRPSDGYRRSQVLLSGGVPVEVESQTGGGRPKCQAKQLWFSAELGALCLRKDEDGRRETRVRLASLRQVHQQDPQRLRLVCASRE